MAEKHTRRAVLRTTAVAGGVLVAGCSSETGSNGGGEPTETSTPADTGGSGGSGGDGWQETSTVDMTDDLTFDPKKIRVSTGTAVTWENVGTIGHTVTAVEDEIPDGAAYFASGGYGSEQAARDAYSNESGGNIPQGESYSHTFETPGEYKYLCIPHELSGMVGFVEVE